MHVMVDIETLSLHPHNALILSVGAMYFHNIDDRLGPKIDGAREWVLDLRAQLALGRHVDPNTVSWWVKQEPDAKAHWLHGDVEPLEEASREIAEFLAVETVWANGINFDLTNIQSLLEQNAMSRPWAYNAARDYRTVRDSFPKYRTRPPDIIKIGAAHTPLADCKEQIWTLWEHWPIGG